MTTREEIALLPRPYWQHETFGRLHVTDQRGAQPSAWRELHRAAPAMVAEQREVKS